MILTALTWAAAWKKVKAVFAAIPWPVYAAAALLLAGWLYGNHRESVGEDRVQAEWDAEKAQIAAEREKAEQEARKVEERHRAEYKAIAERFIADQRKADEEHAALVADLRAGAVRVRERFRCPPPAGMSAAAAATGRTDSQGNSGFGVEDAATAIGIARDGDREIRRLNALIEVLKANGNVTSED